MFILVSTLFPATRCIGDLCIEIVNGQNPSILRDLWPLLFPNKCFLAVSNRFRVFPHEFSSKFAHLFILGICGYGVLSENQ